MIADKIKALREAKGITQAELARSLSITRGGVNSWEQDFSTPTPASIVELAKFFGVSTDYLLGVSSSQAIDTTGLSQRDVALLAELSERLKQASKQQE